MVNSSQPRVVQSIECLHSEIALDVACSSRKGKSTLNFNANVCYCCGKVFLLDKEKEKYDAWLVQKCD